MTRIFKSRQGKESRDVIARRPVPEGQAPRDSLMRDADDQPTPEIKPTDRGSFDERQRLLFC